MGKGSQTTTASSSLPPQFLNAYSSLLGQANTTLAQNPFQNYTGPMVAGLQPAQTEAIGNIANLQGVANPYINAASQEFGAATTPLWPGVAPVNGSTINQYLSPFTEDVTKATQGQFANLNEQQQNSLQGNAIAQGAFGGDRASVAQGILAGQQTAQEAPVLAGIENQGYTTALQTAQQQQQAQLGANEANAWLESQAGFGMGNLGQEALGTGLEGSNALLGAGGLEQQIAQEQLNVPYYQFEAQQAAPYQQLNWLSGITEGLGSGAGGNSSTTVPGPSTGQQVLGGVMDAASLAALAFAMRRGGGIRVPRGILPERDVGGSVPADYDYFSSIEAPGYRGKGPPSPPPVQPRQQQGSSASDLVGLASLAANSGGGSPYISNSDLMASNDAFLGAEAGSGLGDAAAFGVSARGGRLGILPHKRASGGGFSYIKAPNGVMIPQLDTGSGGGSDGAGGNVIPPNLIGNFTPPPLARPQAPPAVTAPRGGIGTATEAANTLRTDSTSAPLTVMAPTEPQAQQQTSFLQQEVNDGILAWNGRAYVDPTNPLAMNPSSNFGAARGGIVRRQDGGDLDQQDIDMESGPEAGGPPPPPGGGGILPQDYEPDYQPAEGPKPDTSGDRWLAISGLLANMGAQAVSPRPNYGAAIAGGMRDVMAMRAREQQMQEREAERADTAAYRKADLKLHARGMLDSAQNAAARLKQQATSEQDRRDEAADTRQQRQQQFEETMAERRQAEGDTAAYRSESLAQLKGQRAAQEAAARSEADLRDMEKRTGEWQSYQRPKPGGQPGEMENGTAFYPKYGGEPTYYPGATMGGKGAPKDTDPQRVEAVNSQFKTLWDGYQKTANSDNPSAGFKMPSADEVWQEAQSRVDKAYGRQQPSGGAPSTPPQQAIDYLKANPTLRAQFDAKYGPGASERYLGTQ